MSRERGAVYWNEVILDRAAARPQRSWRLLADRINIDLCRGWWPRARPARVLKTDMFDEASGVGLWPTLMAGSGIVCGIDHAIDTIRSARIRYATARTATADVRGLPFRDGAFDLVISNSTLDHFDRRDDIAVCLTEIYRVLAPGGRLILTLDNPRNPIVALRNALPFALLKGAGLVPYFVGATAGPDRGRRMLTEAGFSVVHMKAVMHCPRAAAVATASLLDRFATPGMADAFVRFLGSFETMAGWPGRFVTGYFVAFAADKA